MQEKRRFISPIKQNILHFIEMLNISKREFYKNTGISRGTLESSTGITEDTMAKFIAIYNNVNLIWLISGKGEMTNNPIIQDKKPIIYKENNIQSTLEEEDGRVTRLKNDLLLQKEMNEILKLLIKKQEKEITYLELKLDNLSKLPVGDKLQKA